MATFLRERGFAAGYALSLAGVAFLLIGLALDVILHANDPDLAEKEGVFGLSNPGHLLLMVGLFYILTGAFLGPYSRWVLSHGSALLSLLVPVAALAVALAVSIGFSLKIDAISSDSHASEAATAAGSEHDATASGHDGSATVLPQHREVVQLAESTRHEPPNSAPVTEDNLRFAEDFLAKARAETARFQDVAVAQSEGYFQITQDLPLIGAHFFKPTNVGSLEPGQPGILLYEKDAGGGWELVGLNLMLPKQPGVDTPPETPFGGLAHWHYHTDLCFGPGAVSIAASAADCTGLFVAETPWLLHVWVWKDSPEGVFDHANSLLQ